MARCPTCNKFPALETEVELYDDPEVQEDGTTTATVRLVRKCQEDGEEIKEFMLELESSTVTLDEGEEEECSEGEDSEHVWEYDAHDDPESTERMQVKDRHGKPIKNSRYAKTYIGAEMHVHVKCTDCGATGTVELSDETTAGSFEELV